MALKIGKLYKFNRGDGRYFPPDLILKVQKRKDIVDIVDVTILSERGTTIIISCVVNPETLWEEIK